MKKLLSSSLLCGLLLAAPALAQNEITTPTPGRPVPGAAIFCINGLGQGVPCTNITTPFGELAVMPTPQNLFKDTFDTSFDTTNNWNVATAVGGGVTVAQSPGQITLGTGTTANGYSYTTSKPSFGLTEPGFVETTVTLMLPAVLPANTYAAWGGFTPTATPTAASPIQEGCGFEVQPGGKMYVVCYAGAVRAVIQDLSATGNNKQPTDGHTHSYYQFTAGGQFYWAIDGTTAANIVAVQTSGINGPNVNTQPVALLTVAGTSNPISSLTMTVAAVWVAVTNANGWISDGIYPYRKATVKASATPPTPTDFPLVTAAIPTDPCASSGIVKSSVPINVTSATTTPLVPTSGTTTVYVCGFSITIAPSATAADTALFERGTGAACVTTQAPLTGTYGAGDLTTTAPVVPISYGGAGQTIFHSAGTDAICIVTTGTAVNVQGLLTYVQQ